MTEVIRVLQVNVAGGMRPVSAGMFWYVNTLCWLSSDAGASWDKTEPPVVREENHDEGEWEFVLQTNRPRMQQVKESDAFEQSRSKSQSPTPRSKSSVKA